MGKNKVIYTSIVGGYDPLRKMEVVSEDFDYICFTDDLPEGSRVGEWEIRPIPSGESDPARRSRIVKILPQSVLPEYEWSVWIDANIVICSDEFYRAVDRAIESGDLIAQVPHPHRDCIYEEALHCCTVGRSRIAETRHQLKHLKEAGFPRGFGLFENNIILRKHSDKRVQRACSMWWNEYCMYTKRDQFSLMYVYWKTGLSPALLLGPGINARNASCVKYYHHGTENLVNEMRVTKKKTLRGGVMHHWRKACAGTMKKKYLK